MFTVRSWVAALFTVLLLAGCDTTTPQPERQVVVEAYLQAGATLGQVRLTRSVSTDEAYVPADAAVRGADVTIRRLGPEGTPAATHDFREVQPGVYTPIDSVRVRPRATYRLTATTGNGTDVTATTTVPDTIDIVRVENREALYQGPDQPRFVTTAPRSDRKRQSILVLTTTSLLDFENTPTSELRAQLTPPYASTYDAEEDSITTLRVTSSGLLNEENFDSVPGGGIEIQLPWLSVAFYGPNEVAVHVVDDNLYDFIRSQQVQQGGPGGGGLAPGEIPNVIEHVKGGTGIFGSYARASRRIVVQRPDTSRLRPSRRGPVPGPGSPSGLRSVMHPPFATGDALQGTPQRERR